jgi:hypothetical protein
MVRIWTYMLAALAIFTRKPLKFNVTPKGHSSVPRSAYMPQLVLLVLSVVAPLWATLAYREGWVYYNASGWGSMAFWMNGVWAAWNCYFALYVVRHSLRMKQERDDHRFAEQLAVDVRVARDEGALVIPAMTADLNPAGLGFRATQRLEPGAQVTIDLPIGADLIPVSGQVRHVNAERSRLGTVYMHGVEFDEVPMEARDKIELYCTQHSMRMWRIKYRQSVDMLTLAREMLCNLRRQRRQLAGLPAKVQIESTDTLQPAPTRMILEEISESGARLVGDAPIAPGTAITFEVPGAAVSGGGIVRHVQTLRTSVALLYSIGVELRTVPVATRRWLPWFVKRSGVGTPAAVAEAPAPSSEGQAYVA